MNNRGVQPLQIFFIESENIVFAHIPKTKIWYLDSGFKKQKQKKP